MYHRITGVDAVISVAAPGALDDFATLTTDALHDNMLAKFYGQVYLVLTGQHHCNDGASFTLTSGIFADQAWPHVTGGGVISGAPTVSRYPLPSNSPARGASTSSVPP
jgi:hypothetical protein